MNLFFCSLSVREPFSFGLTQNDNSFIVANSKEMGYVAGRGLVKLADAVVWRCSLQWTR